MNNVSNLGLGRVKNKKIIKNSLRIGSPLWFLKIPSPPYGVNLTILLYCCVSRRATAFTAFTFIIYCTI